MAEKETEEPKEELYIQYGPDTDTKPTTPAVVAEPTSIDYGNGMIARRLMSGNWVLQDGDKFKDLRSPNHKWKQTDNWFCDCVGTLEEVEKASGWISPDKRMTFVSDTHRIKK